MPISRALKYDYLLTSVVNVARWGAQMVMYIGG